MVRIKNSIARRQGRKRVLRKAKGQFGHRKTRYKQALRSVIKGMAYAYRDRKVKKREYRALWVVRLNAACREEGIAYSRFINGLKNANVVINRKVMADLTISDPIGFSALVALAKKSVSQPAAKPAKA